MKPKFANSWCNIARNSPRRQASRRVLSSSAQKEIRASKSTVADDINISSNYAPGEKSTIIILAWLRKADDEIRAGE